MLSEPYDGVVHLLLETSLNDPAPAWGKVDVYSYLDNTEQVPNPCVYFEASASEDFDTAPWDGGESPLTNVDLSLTVYCAADIAKEVARWVHRAIRRVVGQTVATDDGSEYTTLLRAVCTSSLSATGTAAVGGKSIIQLSARYALNFRET